MLYCGPLRGDDGRCALSQCFDGNGICLKELSGNPAEALLEAMGDNHHHTQRRLEQVAQRQVRKYSLRVFFQDPPTSALHVDYDRMITGCIADRAAASTTRNQAN